VFDYDTRVALNRLAENGYINCLLAGNAMCTHDLEGGFLRTALGQNIYTQENVPMGHYNHLYLLNEVRTIGSIKDFIASGNVKDGIIKTLSDMDIPFVLSGSIRDDGPLPEVYKEVTAALTATKEKLNEATLIIGLATMLHNLSAANMASGYRVREDGRVTPVYMYVIDVTENVANKVGAARENMAFVPMITNVQDFVVNCEKALVKPADKNLTAAMELPEMEYAGLDKKEEAATEMAKDNAKTETAKPAESMDGLISETPQTFTIFLNFDNKPFDSNWMIWKEIAKETNVSLEGVISQSNANEEEAFSMMLASGKLADIIGYKNPADLEKLGRDGGLIPLNDLIKEHAPDLQKVLDNDAKFRSFATSLDGNIYFIPKKQKKC